MPNDDAMALALALLQADRESEVIALLEEQGYWDDPSVWRDFGDVEGNYSTIGNQARYPDAALVEKIVNSVDARLTNECRVRGIDPTSEDAPRSIEEAVGLFIADPGLTTSTNTSVATWDKKKRLEEARRITVAVTGATARSKGSMPSVTISDVGEGQAPAELPNTFLSLNETNKLRIRFVQGKFNQGGTGALKFCGREGLQFVLTRKNPQILQAQGIGGDTIGRWGFTVVRRFRPTGDAGDVRNSVFRYLAPVQAIGEPGRGAVLSFDATSLKVLPKKNEPYARPMQWGSIVKLYEYDMKGYKGHALLRRGLLRRLEVLLPDIALPVRIHECRALGGVKARSFATNLVGLTARLQGAQEGTLEPGFPSSSTVSVGGSTMPLRIYAFLPGKAETYRGTEGIIFAVNGQTHGHLESRFFNRRRVGMSRLAKDLLVVVECSRLPNDYREDLFMTSRDRFSGGSLWKELEDQLEDMIGKHSGLLELRNRRQQEAVAERLKDSEPLAKALNSVLKSSPTLSRVLLAGNRLGVPHRPRKEGRRKKPSVFRGKRHPTYWRFYQKRDGHRLVRDAELGRKCRMRFETDVENKYLDRAREPGSYDVEIVDGPVKHIDHNLNLHDGIANWSLALSSEELSVGDRLVLRCSVTDVTLTQPFVAECEICVIAPRKKRKKGKKGKRLRKPNSPNGDRGGEGGMALPVVIPVAKGDSNWIQHGFDDHTGCIVFDDGSTDGTKPRYTFLVNTDNRYLRTEMKYTSDHAGIVREKYICGNVLVGLAILNDSTPIRGASDDDGGEPDRLTLVAKTTRMLSPVLLPMINISEALNLGTSL